MGGNHKSRNSSVLFRNLYFLAQMTGLFVDKEIDVYFYASQQLAYLSFKSFTDTHVFGVIPDLSLIHISFERTAGYAALVWGFIGIIIATLLSYLTGWHYHGLLHFGWAPNPAWWCFAVEHLVVWLIPAILFYIGGLLDVYKRQRLLRAKVEIYYPSPSPLE